MTNIEMPVRKAYSTRNDLQLLRGGRLYFDKLTGLIDKARESIFIRTYILEEDQTGVAVCHALIRASLRGVNVYLVADGYASQGLSRTLINDLQTAGIHFRFFEPLLRSTHFYFGRRMHEKVTVIDKQHGLVGGINLSDHYNDIGNVPAWLDFAVYITGDAAYELYRYCAKDWGLYVMPTENSNITSLPNCSVRISRNDWVKGKHQIWKTYFHWFNHAEESITIMCSYFLPGRVLRKRLAAAAARGVRVRIILAGPSDVKLAKYAERFLYDWMLRHKIEIYEYQPSVLHAKIMTVDYHWVTIGSFNVNNISAYASTELNLDIRNRPFASLVTETVDQIIKKDCIRISRRNWVSAPTLFRRFLERSAYDIVRLIINLSTFYFKRE